MPLIFGAQGVTPSLRGQPTNVFELEAGQVMLIPAGGWSIVCGKYTVIQQYDPVTGTWRVPGGSPSFASRYFVQSDGVNFRIANQTGCVVGALLTAAGSGYTSAPTVTSSAGGAVLQAIVGGAVNTSITVSNGGTGYTYPPLVQFSSPGNPGIQATGYSTLSGGAVSSVTVTDQGAGYTSAPSITFINDPREGQNGIASGYNAAATCTLTGAQTVTGVVVLDHGQPQTSLPTLSFAGGGGSGATAYAIMAWTLTGYTVNTAGSGYAGAVEVSALGGFPTTASAYTNPTTQSNLLKGHKATLIGALSGGTVTATGQTIYDGGLYPGVPTPIIYGYTNGNIAGLSLTVGGTVDTVLMFAN